MRTVAGDTAALPVQSHPEWIHLREVERNRESETGYKDRREPVPEGDRLQNQKVQVDPKERVPGVETEQGTRGEVLQAGEAQGLTASEVDRWERGEWVKEPALEQELPPPDSPAFPEL